MAVKAGATIDLNALKVAGEPNKYITYIDNTGIRVHEAGAENTNFIQINSTGMQVYKGGQTDAYKIAEFGSTTYIGKHNGSQSYMKLDASSFKMIDKEGGTYASIEDLRGTSGTANLTITFIGDGEQKRFNLLPVATNNSYTVNVSDSSGGTITKATDRITFSTAPTEGSTITVTYSSTDQSAKIYTFGFRNSSTNKGACSICAGVNGTASGNFSFVTGTGCMATGYASHAEGGYTIASGEYSHAEGYGVLTKSSGKASGKYSHVEGWGTTASGTASHAEGDSSEASGMISHAEGRATTASGAYSHASGLRTNAISTCQFVIGESNIPDAEVDETTGRGQFAFIIGNGSDVQDIQSNAFAVDWQGNIYPNNEKMANFIVEQGTSGICKYRKWSDGTAECWGRTASKAYSLTSSSGYGYYTGDSVSLPSGLFTSVEYASCQRCGGNDSNYLTGTAINSISVSQFGFFFWSTLSTTSLNVSFAFHVIGRWK